MIAMTDRQQLSGSLWLITNATQWKCHFVAYRVNYRLLMGQNRSVDVDNLYVSLNMTNFIVFFVYYTGYGNTMIITIRVIV